VYKRQALKKLGIDSETVRSKYPNKIYCLITGYGTDGPYAGMPTYDSVVQVQRVWRACFYNAMANPTMCQC
jgi:crotonobetainyl-CoA:carnitine CoA-transferase CaiB-like acyl-CoA transferase